MRVGRGGEGKERVSERERGGGQTDRDRRNIYTGCTHKIKKKAD